jgi:catechol 2,3-dioxygenase-like lactoylglutathione lyase family enzyme/predicted enzyme related to lactoylglutathione lyase
MHRHLFLSLFLFAPIAAFAQLTAPNDSGVSIGHIHLFSKDPDAQKRIWVEVFGAQQAKTGTLEMLRLPGVFVVIDKAAAPAGSVGSTADHIGLSVRNIDDIKTKLASMNAQVDATGFVTLPDGLRLELLENKSQTLPIVMHHIHLAATNGEMLRKWYVKTFGAENGSRANLPTATFNGNEIDFLSSPGAQAPAATRGRVIDHIGFEVRNLEAFAKNLQAEGMKFEGPYRDMPNLGLKVAFIVDVVGTRIELTEGLRGK